MPRRARVCVPDIPMHIVQRGHNREASFFADEDRLYYLEQLQRLLPECGCALHAYVLMTNHVHLLLTPETQTSAGLLMKHLSQRYVQYVNRTYRRSGTIWEGRFRSSLVQSETYLLTCYRYIELNPVRAGMVQRPSEYRWSSYGENANGDSPRMLSEDDGTPIAPLLTPHREYKRLDREIALRQRAYKKVVAGGMDPAMSERITKTVLGGFALGESRFTKKMEALLGQRVTPGFAGRPRMTEED
jgi:putative transposase